MAASVARARRAPRVQVMPWSTFAPMFFRAHRQGEHVAGVGPTGSGKTVALLELGKLIGQRRGRDSRRPARVVVIGTKRRDDTLSQFQRVNHWPTIRKWPPAYGQEHCVVWPRGGPQSSLPARQAAVIGPLLDTIHQEGGQTVIVDEAAYFERAMPKGLGLSTTMEGFWSEARSSKLTLIAGTQRPRHVTLLMWTEPSWLVIFPPEEEEDLKLVASKSGRGMRDTVIDVVDRLGAHEFLCVRKQRGGGRGLYVSKVGT